MSHLVRTLPPILAALAAAVASPAQSRWVEMASLTPRDGHGLWHDALHNQTLLFGGGDGTNVYGDTWRLTGSSWQLVPTTTAPSPRRDAMLAYDPVQGALILFGGRDTTNLLSDTWRFDGQQWTQLMPLVRPTPRADGAMAWHAGTAQMVLFGGENSSTLLGDTWVFAAGNWQLRSGLPTAPARRGAACASLGSGVLLVGGLGFQNLLSDTWLWNGTQWLLQTPVTTPTARVDAACGVEASGAVVVAGGRDSTGPNDETWRYANGTWSLLGHDARVASYDAAMAPSANGAEAWLVVGRGDTARRFGTTYAMNPLASAWQLQLESPTPEARSAGAFAELGGGPLLFGGAASDGTDLGDVWELRNASWRRVAQTGPVARQHASMATLLTGTGCVLFGGITQGTVLDDTWVWNGANWVAHNPLLRPLARSGAGMCEHPFGGVFLFSGNDDLFLPIADAWHWTNNSWQRVQIPLPPPRSGHGMAYDRHRQQVVLFGGSSLTGTLGDTWTFDGTQWTQRTVSGPLPRAYARMVAANFRQRVLLHGGFDSSFQPLDDTWEWNGSAWLSNTLSPRPPSGADAHLAEDPATGDLVRFGGLEDSFASARAFRFRPDYPPAASTFGTPCVNPLGPVVLTANPATAPWLGELYQLTASGMPNTHGLAIVITGSSTQDWYGTPLPLQLTQYGMPLCTLYTSVLATTLAVRTTSSQQFALLLPQSPWLRGFTIYHQLVAFDPAYNNPSQAALSNAVETLLGAH